MFWKRKKTFDPTLHAEDILRQRCFRCSGEYEDWDRRLHPSLFSSLPECGKIRGQFVRYCSGCHLGEIYFVTRDGISDFTWQITLDYLPPTEILGSNVDHDHVRNELTTSDNVATKFKLESRIFLDTIRNGDEIRAFCSLSEDWQRLAGRKGYAIIRNGEPIAAIITMLS